ncbi:hypothetical protein K2X30_05665 [bacterium]|nr:hypothetical protein [bacterium]
MTQSYETGFRKLRIRFLFTLLIVAMLDQPHSTLAADGAPADQAFMSQFNSTLGAFDKQRLANVYTSCNAFNDQFAQGLGSLYNLSKTGKGSLQKVGVETNCGMVPAVSEKAKFSCEDFKLLGGKIDNGRIDKRIAEYEGYEKVLKCRDSKATALRGEMTCLANQSRVLNDQIAQTQAYYSQNIQRFRQAVDQINRAIKDAAEKKNSIDNKLRGDENKPGLLTLSKQYADPAFMGQMSAEITQQKEAQIALQNAKDAFEVELKQLAVSRALSCFKDPGQSNAVKRQNVKSLMCFDPKTYKTTSNVSSYDYVVCMAAQYGYNNTSTGASDKNAASDQARDNAQSILNALISEAPSLQDVTPLTKVARGATEGADPSLKTTQINSPDDIERLYGAKLNSIDPKIHDFVMQELKRCYTTEQAKITVDRNKAGTSIHRKQADIQQNQQTLSKQGTIVVDKYASAYSQIMETLTGSPNALNVQNCRGENLNPNIQAACFDQIEDNMKALVNGESRSTVDGQSVPISQMTITIKGTNPQTWESVSCPGLNGCIKALQTFGELKQNQVNYYGEQKVAFVKNANTGITNFTQQMINSMGAQAQSLDQQLKRIQSGLGEFSKTEGKLSVPPVTKVALSEMKKDGDELMQVPDDLKGLIGGNTNPPLADLSNSSFSEAQGIVAKAAQEVAAEKTGIVRIREELASLKMSCANSQFKDILARNKAELNSTYEKIVSDDYKCFMSLCDGTKADSLNQIIRATEDVSRSLDSNSASLEAGDISTLYAGLNGVCEDAESKKDKFEKGVTNSTDKYKFESKSGDCRKFVTNYQKLITPLQEAALRGTNSGGADR